MHIERHHLAEMNGDMVVSVAEFLDNAGDDDLEMDKNGGLKVCTISFERLVNYLCHAWHVFPPKYEAWTHFNMP